jgi:hypothetical protein
MKAMGIIALIVVFAAIGYAVHDPALTSIMAIVAVVAAGVGAWASGTWRKKP